MKEVINLAEKKILIAGASSGIGAETAKLCSQLGAKVVLIARREDKLKEVLNGLEGTGHRYYPFDLSNPMNIEVFFNDLIDTNGPMDGFVYSAGIPGTRPLKMLKPLPLNDIMNINFHSFIECVRCITKKKAFNPGLSIVGVSSISSTMGSLGKTGYCASKAAMDAAVRCIAKELASLGIRANTVCPGVVNTAIYQTFQNNAGDSEDAKKKVERQYLGVCEPTDIANMITFLLSDASRMITGASIGVDGGLLSS